MSVDSGQVSDLTKVKLMSVSAGLNPIPKKKSWWGEKQDTNLAASLFSLPKDEISNDEET